MLDNQLFKLKANDKNDLKVFAFTRQYNKSRHKIFEKNIHLYLIDLCGKMQRRGFSEITRGLDRH